MEISNFNHNGIIGGKSTKPQSHENPTDSSSQVKLEAHHFRSNSQYFCSVKEQKIMPPTPQ